MCKLALKTKVIFISFKKLNIAFYRFFCIVRTLINKILTISILEPIKPGLKKEIFLKELENVIYSELDILN